MSKNLEVGKSYIIEFDDCCVHGWFKAGEFLGWQFDEDDEEKEIDYADALFEHGEIGSGWGRWEAREIETKST